jgi:hypothetical protein
VLRVAVHGDGEECSAVLLKEHEQEGAGVTLSESDLCATFGLKKKKR